jgi:hypothetical protein
MPSLKNLRSRIKSVTSTRGKVRMIPKFSFLGALFMAVATTSASAAPANSPEALVQQFKAFNQAKNCDGLMSLVDLTNTTTDIQEITKDTICSFDAPLGSVTYTPWPANEPQPSFALNLPAIGKLHLSTAGDNVVTVSYYVGQKDGNFYIARPTGQANQNATMKIVPPPAK